MCGAPSRSDRSRADRLRLFRREAIERANARRSYLVRALAPPNFSEQQTIADAFYRAGLLPAPVETKQALYWDLALSFYTPSSAVHGTPCRR
ncbi:hypothetical protein OKW34_007161 [Paraburkholderia youngii]